MDSFKYSNGEAIVTSGTLGTVALLQHGGTAFTLGLALFNLDVTGSLFKVIQIINFFEKLRLVNVNHRGLLGKFLRSVGKLFENNFFGLGGKKDYNEVTKPS
jgi:hypothetical protein